jgi:2-polyprenyl-3-methyl-5-hydroxy-6-metoxy-1,4-benzoquinol methylase
MKFGWKIIADPKKVSEFQDWHATNHLNRFFSNVYGAAMIRELKRYVTLSNAIVVDYGAGPGFLTKRLIHEGSIVYAVDISEESLNILKKNNPTIAGVILAGSGSTSLKSGFADAVILAETIEHLDDQLQRKIISDIYRILKPSGKLFLTCPNNEDLEAATICCPNCGGAFHPVLHLKSFTVDSVKTVLSGYGFSRVTSRATSWSLNRYPNLVVRAIYRIIKRKLPHLYCIAEK